MQSSISERCLENQDQNTSTDSNHPLKKDSFQATSGVWANTLSRGLIDLNILSVILARGSLEQSRSRSPHRRSRDEHWGRESRRRSRSKSRSLSPDYRWWCSKSV